MKIRSTLTEQQVYEMYAELNKEMTDKDMFPIAVQGFIDGNKYPTKKGDYFLKFGWNDEIGYYDTNKCTVYKCITWKNLFNKK